MRPVPDHGDMDEIEKYLSGLEGEQLYVFEGVDGMRYVTQEDGSKKVEVLVRWEGFPLNESSYEDPVECGFCTAAELPTYLAGLLDLTKERGT